MMVYWLVLIKRPVKSSGNIKHIMPGLLLYVYTILMVPVRCFIAVVVERLIFWMEIPESFWMRMKFPVERSKHHQLYTMIIWLWEPETAGSAA